MKLLSLKLKEDIFAETERVLQYYKKSRNAYINEALAHYNKLQKRRWIENQLHEESKMVRANSSAVLKELELVGDGG